MTFRELNRGKCKTYLAISEASRKVAVIDPLQTGDPRGSKVNEFTF
jgi:hypothetical protein